MSKANSDNGDMWAECWKLSPGKQMCLAVIKIPRSHATIAMEETGIISTRDRVGNDWADQYADREAALSPATKIQIQDSVCAHYRFRYIQKRLAAVSIIHNDRPTRTVPKATPPPAPIPRPMEPTVHELVTSITARGHFVHKVRHRRTTICRCGRCSCS